MVQYTPMAYRNQESASGIDLKVRFPPAVEFSSIKNAFNKAYLRGSMMVEAVQRYSNSEVNILSQLERVVQQASF
jgi:hypothetical protein